MPNVKFLLQEGVCHVDELQGVEASVAEVE